MGNATGSYDTIALETRDGDGQYLVLRSGLPRSLSLDSVCCVHNDVDVVVEGLLVVSLILQSTAT